MQNSANGIGLNAMNTQSFTVPVQEATSMLSSYVTRLQEAITRIQESVSQFFTQVQTGLTSVLAGCVAINQCIQTIQGIFTPNFSPYRSDFSQEQISAMIKNFSIPKR